MCAWLEFFGVKTMLQPVVEEKVRKLTGIDDDYTLIFEVIPGENVEVSEILNKILDSML